MITVSDLAKIGAIALNTFKEAVRNRVLYVLLFFAILILLGAWVASTLAIFGQDKIMRDLGVAAINVVAVLIAIFVGLNLVYNDLDKKTIYTIISKPISRWQFLVGKYFGLLLTIYVNILVMAFFFLAVLYFREYTAEEVLGQLAMEGISGGGLMWYYFTSAVQSFGRALLTVVSLGAYHNEISAGIMASTFLTMLEMAVIVSFAVLFSSFSSPTLSAFLTLFVFVIGRMNEDLYYLAILMARRAGGFENLEGGQVLVYHFTRLASHVAPNLSVFNQRDLIAQQLPLQITTYSITYGLVYAAGVLLVAALIFNRRNFK